MEKQPSKVHISKGKARFLAALIIIAGLIIWAIWGNSALTLTRIEVKSPALPTQFDGFRIAHISDLHDATFGEDNARLDALIRECAPDIIVITGDLIDSNRTDIDLSLSFVRRIADIAPIYYVTGNHEGALMEYWQLREGLEQAGAHVMTDKYEKLTRDGAYIRLVGIDDPNFATRDEIAQGFRAMIRDKVSALTAQDEYCILLAHRPEYIQSYAEGGAELALCGHAHGGQIRLPFVGGLIAPGQGLFPKYDAGLYTVGDTAMVVNRGLGNSVIPLRINNRPEVVLITLKSE